jgi:ubiquinone/menaquinone biosynthesis C-methylase UbiE
MAESRFARTAGRMAALQDERASALAERVRRFVLPRGDEAALDVGCGAGALALALAPLVQSVVGVDEVTELLALARERAPANASFVQADAARLPFDDFAFDLAGTLRTLHHVRRPEVVLAELVRVTRPGGRVLVIDQLAPVDPLAALAVDRFEQARDPSHTRLLPEIDLRQLFEANDLTLIRSEQEVERRELGKYLEIAGCEGAGREQALALAPEGKETYTATLGWYLLERR